MASIVCEQLCELLPSQPCDCSHGHDLLQFVHLLLLGYSHPLSLWNPHSLSEEQAYPHLRTPYYQRLKKNLLSKN